MFAQIIVNRFRFLFIQSDGATCMWAHLTFNAIILICVFVKYCDHFRFVVFLPFCMPLELISLIDNMSMHRMIFINDAHSSHNRAMHWGTIWSISHPLFTNNIYMRFISIFRQTESLKPKKNENENEDPSHIHIQKFNRKWFECSVEKQKQIQTNIQLCFMNMMFLLNLLFMFILCVYESYPGHNRIVNVSGCISISSICFTQKSNDAKERINYRLKKKKQK